MGDLTKKKCVPCEGKVAPLGGEEIERLADSLNGGWRVINDHHIEKEFYFKNFKEALSFTNKLAEVAENEGHHPDIHLSWGRVRVLLWTHSINGLSENDFILAAKCDLIR